MRYNSVYKAFDALGLEIRAHGKFRAELKKALSLSYTEKGKTYNFKIVE